MNCRTCRDNLSEFVDERLTAADRARVERHVDSCSACAKELEELRGMVSELRELPRPAVPSDLLPTLKASFRRELEGASRSEDDNLSLWRRLGAFRVAAAFAALTFTAFMLIERRGESILSPRTEAEFAEEEERFGSRGEPGIPKVGEMRGAGSEPAAPLPKALREKLIDKGGDDALARRSRGFVGEVEQESDDGGADAGSTSRDAFDVDSIRPEYMRALDTLYGETKAPAAADAAGRDAIVARALKVTRQLGAEVHWGVFEGSKGSAGPGGSLGGRGRVGVPDGEGAAAGPGQARGTRSEPGARPAKPRAETGVTGDTKMKKSARRSSPAAVFLASGAGALDAIRTAAGAISAVVGQSPITTLEDQRTKEVAGHEIVVTLPEARFEAFVAALEARKDLSLGLLATNRPAGVRAGSKKKSAPPRGDTIGSGRSAESVDSGGAPGTKTGTKLVTVHFIVPGR